MSYDKTTDTYTIRNESKEGKNERLSYMRYREELAVYFNDPNVGSKSLDTVKKECYTLISASPWYYAHVTDNQKYLINYAINAEVKKWIEKDSSIKIGEKHE